MAIEIRRTIVTTGQHETVVQLHISDAPLDDASATLRIELLATLPNYVTPLQAHLQRGAMSQASQALSALLQQLANEIQKTHHELRPVVQE